MRAATLARQLFEHNPASLHAGLLYAKVLLDDPSKNDKTESILLHCHQKNPQHIETAHLLGLLYYRQKRYGDAIRILEGSLGSEVPVELKQLLCECYLKNGDSIPYLRLQYLMKWSVCNKKRTFPLTWLRKHERAEFLCNTSRAYRWHTQKCTKSGDQLGHRERTTNLRRNLNQKESQAKILPSWSYFVSSITT